MEKSVNKRTDLAKMKLQFQKGNKKYIFRAVAID